MKNLIIISFILNLLTLPAFPEIINKVKVIGNNRISQTTIENSINIEKGKNYSVSNLNNLQKKLFETNFFQDVNLKLSKDILIITVKENPIVDFFYINGIQNKEREKVIYDSIDLGNNKIFSESILKKDIETIKGIYLESGFFNVNVIPKISKLKGNSLNVILDIERDKKFRIRRIFFIGDKFFKSSTLNDVVSSSEHGWWKFLSTSSTVNEKRIEYDENLLKNFYLNEGFIDAQVVSSNIDIVSTEYANITYSINSGKKYYFSKFEIIDNQNNLNNENKNFITELLKNRLNGNYSQEVLNGLREDIYDYLNQNKIEFVKFDIQTGITKDNKVNIFLNFSKTKRQFINLINVKGNSITEEIVIRRNLTFSEGDTFAEHKLEKSKDNLKNTGIFKEVKTKVSEAGSELINLEVDVEEQPTGSISAGLGVGSDSSSVSTGIRERNLFGKGINVNSNVSVGTDQIKGIISFDFPDYKFSGNEIGYDIFVRATDFNNAGYESTVAGNSISIKYDLFEDISLKTGFGIEHDKITTSSTASALYKSRKGNYLTYKGFYSIENDKRDRKFQTTNGYKVGFGQTLATPGSDVPYIGNDLYGSYYKSFSKDYVLNIKAGASTINAFNNKDVKLSDRKFLTSKKLRGFENYGVGPKDGKDHIGGNYTAYSGISSTFPNPLPEKWNAKSILFLDAGNVWGVDYDSTKDIDKIRSSAGLSLDWISPIGPLSFTFSEAISKATGDKDESFSFKIGSSF